MPTLAMWTMCPMFEFILVYWHPNVYMRIEINCIHLKCQTVLCMLAVCEWWGCLVVCAGAPQQVVTQIIRGQPVSTAISAPSTGSSASVQKGLTPGAAAGTLQPAAPHSPRPQQGQVKLTMAQLTQLTQGHVSNLALVLRGSLIFAEVSIWF